MSERQLVPSRKGKIWLETGETPVNGGNKKIELGHAFPDGPYNTAFLSSSLSDEDNEPALICIHNVPYNKTINLTGEEALDLLIWLEQQKPLLEKLAQQGREERERFLSEQEQQER